ncbi:hypothetical protein ACJ41O_003535 [Fusarium nematophilum]
MEPGQLASARPGTFPLEIWQQIIRESMYFFPRNDAFQLCLVSRSFSALAMEAIYESRVFLRPNRASRRGPPPEFWTTYVTLRVLDRVRNEKPAEQHFAIKRIAEGILARMTQDPLEEESEEERPDLEGMVRLVSDLVVRRGRFHTGGRALTSFFVGMSQYKLQRGEGCGWFRDALITVAAHLGRVSLLEGLLNDGSETACQAHGAYLDIGRKSQDGAPLSRPPFNCRPKYVFFHHYTDSYLSRCQAPNLPNFWLGSPIAAAVRTGHIGCVVALLRSQTEHPTELLTCRADVIFHASIHGRADLVRLAIRYGPPLSECQGLWATASPGVHQTRVRCALAQIVQVMSMMNDLEIFDLLYPLLTLGCKMHQPVWWHYQGDDFGCWGMRKLQRAIGCGRLPMVKRLLGLGFKLGLHPLVEPIEKGHVDVVFYLIEAGARLDGALAAAVRQGKPGKAPMLTYLLERGAGRNKETMQMAIREAMWSGSEEMVRLLVDKGRGRGVFNKSAKAGLRRDLEKGGLENMVKLMNIL